MSAEGQAGTTSVPCPKCGAMTGVLESRRTLYGGTRRRRYCTGYQKPGATFAHCAHRFTTIELAAPWPEDVKPHKVALVWGSSIRAILDLAKALGGGGL